MTSTDLVEVPADDDPERAVVVPSWEPAEESAGSARVFGVVSWGSAATTWLAKALNSHPRILCVHAATVPLTYFRPSIQLGGVAYARFLQASAGGYDLVGDVHGFSRYDVDELRLVFGGSFAAAVVVRQPIPRILGQLAQYASGDNENAMDVSYIDDVIAERGIELPDDSKKSKLFVHAANMLNSIVDEQRVGPIFRMEDLTTDPSALRTLLLHLSGGALDPDRSWLEATVSLGRVNSHARRHVELTDAQREIIRRVVWPETWHLYEQLGYERVDI